MDWKSIAPVVGAVAPFAGKLLGGLIPFPGAALIGEQFGKIIARQFGVAETPAAVSEAVANSTEETARVKINAAVEQARIEVNGFVEVEKAYLHAVEVGLVQTGETMRAELGREHPFYTGWRPFIGWVFGIVALAFGLMLVAVTGVTAYRAPDPLKALSDAWQLFAAYFGVLGLVVGVLIPSRSAEKKAAIESSAPMPNAKPAVTPKPSVVAPKTGGIIPKPVGSRD